LNSATKPSGGVFSFSSADATRALPTPGPIAIAIATALQQAANETGIRVMNQPRLVLKSLE
jgi:hypothetical protein